MRTLCSPRISYLPVALAPGNYEVLVVFAEQSRSCRGEYIKNIGVEKYVFQERFISFFKRKKKKEIPAQRRIFSLL